MASQQQITQVKEEETGMSSRNGWTDQQNEQILHKEHSQCLKCSKYLLSFEEIEDHMKADCAESSDPIKYEHDESKQTEEKVNPADWPYPVTHIAGPVDDCKVPTAPDENKPFGFGLPPPLKPPIQLNCPQCNMTFKQSWTLRRHMIIHTGQRPYHCTECEKSFTQSSHLKRHMSSHTGEKSYSCPECDMRFSQSWNLKSHLRRHTGDTPFICPVCNMTFSRAWNLTNHMTTHTGDRSHRCPECGKKFSQPGNLKRHLRVHTGEKPFSCTECDKKFAESGNLKVHIAQSHTEKTCKS